jgi:signal transduction histidine kinase/ActR/RegA family two-component response regulator
MGWPPGPGAMAAWVRDNDWSKTPLGAISQWPASLRIAVGSVLDSPLPTIVLWGPQLIQVYNDAYQPILGERHPAALGQPTRECWPEVWAFNEPIYRRVQDGGERVHFEDQEYVIEPSGVPESRFFTITYTPARDESGEIHGVTVIAMDTTERVRVERERNQARLEQSLLNEQLVVNVQRLQQLDRRHAFQLALADGLRTLSAPEAAVDLASALLGRHLDVSRVMYAEVDETAGTFTIRRDWTASGLASISGEARQLNDFGPEIITSLRAGHAMVVDNIALDPRTAAFAGAYEAINVRANLAIPLVKSGQMVVILSLQNAQPRHWTAEEVELSAEVAERTWATAEAARAQADLRAERDLSQHVFDSMTEGMAMLDRDWIVLRMNAEGLRLGQCTSDQVIGRSHWDVWPEAVGSDLDRFYHAVMETRIAGAMEYRHSFSSDLHTWFEVRANPTQNGGLAVLYRDIEERRQAHERLLASDRRKDEFLAMLAHELRNPLAPISAAAHLLRTGKVDAARVRQTSEIIGRQVQHLTSLVDDLLDVSRVSRGQVELEKTPLEMRGVVVDAVEQVNPLILQRGHHLVLHLAPGAARVLGDAKRLVQVIANLLTNAAKYTHEGGNIRLQMQVEQQQVVLSVQDDGIGLAADLIPHIFELFTQAERSSDRSAGGLGLGLALVKSLVELHGGKVSCASAGLGRGSVFTVSLPLLPADEGAADVAPAVRQPAAAARSLLIMIVDDNVDAALTLAMFLEELGHRVIVEHSSRAGLERAGREQPDVCLLDIGLPEIDGNELARQLRAQSETAAVTLIAVTGYGQEQDRRNSLPAGFDEHLVKPLDIDRLEALLTAVVKR